MIYNYLKDNSIFICLKCNKQINHKQAICGCPLCGHTLFKVARRGTGYPEAFTPPDKHDKEPYKPAPIMTPGDEDAQGGMGTRVRNEDFPRNFRSIDNYERERKTDIPYSDHMFMDGPTGPGVGNGTFYDPESPLSLENQIANELFSGRSQPIGPHNMQKYRSVFERIRRQQKGV
jgi:hypothetical protein